MGHFCVICKRSRPNEAFSGKGHRTHICRKCQRLPKDEREIIERQGRDSRVFEAVEHFQEEHQALRSAYFIQ